MNVKRAVQQNGRGQTVVYPIPIHGLTPSQDWPVDLPEGEYSVKDLLNVCCIHCPNRSFVVHQYRDSWIVGLNVVTFYQSDRHEPAPGALHYWRSQVDAMAPAAPTRSDLIDALASDQEETRLAARYYIDFARDQASLDDLVSQARPMEKAAWVAVGVISVYSQDNTAPQLTVLTMRSALNDDLPGQPGLKALLAMEFARTAQDTTFLKTAAKLPLSATEITGVKRDIEEALRRSPPLREKLLELNPQWAGFSRPEVEALGETNAFVAPAAP